MRFCAPDDAEVSEMVDKLEAHRQWLQRCSYEFDAQDRLLNDLQERIGGTLATADARALTVGSIDDLSAKLCPIVNTTGSIDCADNLAVTRAERLAVWRVDFALTHLKALVGLGTGACPNAAIGQDLDQTGKPPTEEDATGPADAVAAPSNSAKCAAHGHQIERWSSSLFAANEVKNIIGALWRYPEARQGSVSWYAQKMLEDRRFELSCAFVIIANAVTIGIDNDSAMRFPDAAPDVLIEVLENVFAVLYTVELAIRIAAWKRKFFTSPEWRWHIFDTVLVVVAAFYEICMSLVDAGNLNVTFVRLLRILRMSKMFRVVRVTQMFRELRLLMNSVLGSIPTMCWSSLLILLTNYIFGLCLLQACAKYLADNKLTMNEQERKPFVTYWGSMPQSMLSLYWASTGGDSWRFIAEPLKKIGYAYCVFLVYIAFFMIVIVNTLTSLFLEATLQNAEEDHLRVIQDEMNRKKETVQALHKLFNLIDADGSGLVNFEEFCDQLTSPAMQAFCARFQLEIQDVATFFAILSDRGNALVDIDTFVDGCMKLKGTARSMDLLALVDTMAKFEKSTCSFQTEVRKELQGVRRVLGADMAPEEL